MRSKSFVKPWIFVGVLLVLGESLTGCAWTWAFHRHGATANCDGEIVSMDLVPGDFVLRERVRVASRGREMMLELVAEKQGNSLVLVGLHRMGQKAFKIIQTGERVSVQTYWGRPALRPLNVLRDFHRVHFLSLAAIQGTNEFSDGEHAAVRGREQIREVWQAGRLEKRIFEKHTDAAESVEVFFLSENQVRIENHRCEYRVEILQAQ